MGSQMNNFWRCFWVTYLVLLSSHVWYGNCCSGQTPRTLPHDTVIWVHSENTSRAISESMGTELFASLNHLPVKDVAISILSQLQREYHHELGEVDLENEDLGETLKTLFENEFTYAVFLTDKQESSFVRFTLNKENWLGKFILVQLEKLPIARAGVAAAPGPPICEIMGQFVAVQGSTICLASNQTALKHALGIVEGRQASTFSENRKFRTVNQHVDFRSADIAIYVDTGWLLKKWYLANSNYRPLTEELAILEALGFGANVSFKSKGVQWKMDSYLICAQPRSGLWSLLTFGELDLSKHAFVPEDADFSLQLKVDMDGLSKAINAWRDKVPADQFNAAAGDIARFIPFIVVPVMFHAQLAGILSGDVAYYGAFNRHDGVWLSQDCIAIETMAQAEDEAIVFFESMFGNEALASRQSLYGNYRVLGDEAYGRIVDRMRELNQLSPDHFPLTRVPRTAFAVQDNKILLFSAEEACLTHLQGSTEEVSALSYAEDYRMSIALVEQFGSGTSPSVFLYIPGKGLWKWYLLSLTRANFLHRREVWKVELDENNVENLTLVERILKSALLGNQLDFPLTDIQNFSPISAAVFNSQSGMRIVMFQQEPSEGKGGKRRRGK